MAVRVLQNAFNGGEVAPFMYGRIDDQKFQISCAVMRNFICRAQGPAVRRPGFEFVNAVKDSTKHVRLIPFKFNSDQTCVVELGHHYARFHSFGMTVYRNGSVHEITTPYDSEDLDDIEYAQAADVITLVHTKYAPQELARHVDAYGVYFTINAIDFSLGISAPTGVTAVNTYTGKTGDGINPTRYTVAYVVTALKSTADGDIESTASVVAKVSCNLYLNDSSNTITWSASAGAERYRVYKTYSGLYGYIGETTETSFVDNNKEADDGVTPPRFDDPFYMSKGITSVAVTNQGSGYATGNGVASLTGLKKTWTARADDSLVLTARVYDEVGNGSGAQVTLETTKREYQTGAGSGGEADNWEYWMEQEVTLTAIRVTAPGSGYIRPKVQIYLNGGSAAGGWDGLLGLSHLVYDMPMVVLTPTVGVTDATGSGAELSAVVANGKITSITILRAGSGYSNPQVIISAPVGSGATATATVGQGGDYPGAVGYFEQRRCFAGTQQRPRMIWMTRPGTESNFTYTLPSQDDNRIKFNVAAQEAGRINHLIPLTQLIVTTPSTELRVQSVNSDALTPTSFSVKPQAYVGASAVHPQVFNSVMLYVAERGSHIRELGYSNQVSGFTTGDLSVRATHLFDNDKVMDIALAKAPDQILWAVTRSGNLLGMTYMPDQNVAGWHRHDTDGVFESICVVPENDEDILYAVVQRIIKGKAVRYIERMHEREPVPVEDSFFVDCGIVKEYDTATSSITGLLPLAGKEVSILADGGVLPNQTVSETGTLELPVTAYKVIVGIPYMSDLQTLPVAYQTQDGAYGRGHMKDINKVWLRVYRSSGVLAGPSFESLTEHKSRQSEKYGEVPEFVSDEIEIAVTPKWQRSGQLAIRQTYPLPLVVVGITADYAQ